MAKQNAKYLYSGIPTTQHGTGVDCWWAQKWWVNLRSIMLKERILTQEFLHKAVWFDLCEVLEEPELIYDERKTTAVVVPRKVGVWITGKKGVKYFVDGIRVLYLNRALGYMGVCICPSSESVPLRFVHFPVCNFNVNKRKTLNKYCTLVNAMHVELCTDTCSLPWNASKI